LRNNDFRVALVTTAYSRVSLAVPEVTKDSRLVFGYAMKFDLGNGALGQMWFDYGDTRVLLLERYLDPANVASDRKWFDDVIDLSRFEGISGGFITLECYPGPKGDERADWFGWSGLKIVNEP
jgi:hypothetical protein